MACWTAPTSLVFVYKKGLESMFLEEALEIKVTDGFMVPSMGSGPVSHHKHSVFSKLGAEFGARFLDAADQLAEDLHLSESSDLGYLFDSVIRANTIVEKHHGLFSKTALEGIQKKARRVKSAMDEPKQPDQTRSKSAPGQDTPVIFDKTKRFAFPNMQLPIEKLTEEQENVIMSMQGQTLSVVASLSSNMAHKDTTMNMKSTSGTATDIQFISSFIKAYIPAFVLSSSPCQLILSTAAVKGSRIGFAINQTLKEPIKCVPFNIYQPMSRQILQQRRIHEQPLSLSIQPHMKYIKNMTGLSTKSDNASDKAKEITPQIMALLPPPPRVKYSKRNTSVDVNYMLKHPPPSSPIPPVLIEPQDITTVLSTKQRFAWLHDLYKELLKGGL
ncbi:hypothetical protein G6F71_001112 [Rhizopus microsporus]|nr:hypothetical protein G6F71_001112 [Rhizopus microsporus]